MYFVSTTLCHAAAADTVGDAVKSIAPLVDNCIVIWTSEPDTPDEERAFDACSEAAGDKLLWRRWLWRDDFGAARNAALDAAAETGAQWCMWLDSDEEMHPHGQDIRGALELEAQGTLAVNMHDEPEGYLQPRCIKLPSVARWEGRTHEALPVPAVCPVFKLARFWERPKTDDRLKEKAARDVELLKKNIEENPGNPRWYLYLGDSYDALGMPKEAIDAFRKRSELGGWDEECSWACYRAAGVEFLQNNFPESIEWACKGMARHPGIAENPWLAALAAQRIERPAHAVWFAESAKALGYHSTCAFPPVGTRRLFRWPEALGPGPFAVLRDSLKDLGCAEGSAAAAAVVDRYAQKEREIATEAERPRVELVRGPMPKLWVTGTGFKCEGYAGRCVHSVSRQTYKNYVHHYFANDRETYRVAKLGFGDGRLTVHRDYSAPPVFAHLLPLWRTIPDDDVIVFLDGDDELACDQALEVVADAHAHGFWFTYGSFLMPDGQPRILGPSDGNPRAEPWRLSHLKTFRAKLVKSMRDEDFRMPDGRYAGLVTDRRVSFGCYELAGPDRSLFVPKILHRYNYFASFEHLADDASRLVEREECERVHSFARYERLP